MSKRRAIFEEVAADAPRGAVAAPGAAGAARRRNRDAIAVWLLVLAALVSAMVLIGGLTRLTDSGLSIVEWRPVTGAIPPLSAEDWEVEFDKYRAIPEYQMQNRGMSLEAFKFIYWWEWGHRQFGRVIGLVWAGGFLWFAIRRMIPPGWTWRLVLPGALGGVQGFIGWWMVSSGLTGTMLDVASYRLAVHLGLAFVILGLLLHYAWLLRRDGAELLQARRRRLPGPRAFGGAVLAVLFAQIVGGALVAGIDAGRGYTDWPLMAGEWLPSESFHYAPVWRNFTENPALVQFNHRVLGYLAVLAAVGWAIRARYARHEGLKRWTLWVALAALAQAAAGVGTVLHAAPLEWAILHQGGAIVLWGLALRALFESGWPAEEKIARGMAGRDYLSRGRRA
ncbi:MAG: COX15/CtaA family protein [Pseudomonadota bacterium]